MAELIHTYPDGRINLRKSLCSSDASKDDVIFVGALFHDVTKGIEPHHKTGAQLIKTILYEECSEKELGEISEIIEFHNSRNREDLPFHIKIIQDADILDHFGTLEVWLKFMYSAHKEENVFDAIRLWNSTENLEYIRAAKESLNFELSKEIFDKRIEFVTLFQKQFKKECYGNLY